MHVHLREVHPIPSRLADRVEIGELDLQEQYLSGGEAEPQQRRWSWTAA